VPTKVRRNVGTIERAYELAPQCSSVDEIRLALRREGFSQVDEHLSGAVIRSDLKKLLDADGQAGSDAAEPSSDSASA